MVDLSTSFTNRAPKTRNPRSEIQKVGKTTNTVRPANAKRERMGSYNCPKCNKPMYRDEVLDLGKVDQSGAIKRHHRDCPK